MNAFTPRPRSPPLSGAKAAINFTQWLAVHFSQGGHPGQCHIAPASSPTKQNAKLLFNEDGTPTARTGKILAATPLERFGTTEELEEAHCCSC